ncbi:MAG: hypothetical protein ACI37S_08660 [Candidatus Gastranaerophilaceae bacterium]
MGMAASQARFLSLTARKTNIEYEGQQINEQRTTLSNQSASLYNQMLTLSVPTPPNSQDFTKIQYTFELPNELATATVSQISKVSGSTDQYTVSFTYTQTELGFPACTTKQRSEAQKYTKGETISYSGSSWHISDGTSISAPSEVTDTTEIEQYKTAMGITDLEPGQKLYTYTYGTPPTTEYFATSDFDTDKTYIGYNIADGQYSVTNYKGKFQNLTKYDPSNAEQKKIHGDAYDNLIKEADDALYFVNVGTEEAPSYQYYKKLEMDSAAASESDKHCLYYFAGDVETHVEDTYTPCYIERDKNNRVVSFTYKGQDFAVTTNQIVDDDAYEDAMNEYTYKTYLYEQEMNEINAKTSVIQSQDKNLELRLKQLDTEENAIKTEMDAVSSVIKDNIDKSFKTFA